MSSVKAFNAFKATKFRYSLLTILISIALSATYSLPTRVFKTAWFSKAAVKARISDADLCVAIRQVELGQCDDLGGGVFKKRLDKNRHRSIILAKAGSFWVYEFLFVKKDLSNISRSDLNNYRVLARVYAGLSAGQLAGLLNDGELEEI